MSVEVLLLETVLLNCPKGLQKCMVDLVTEPSSTMAIYSAGYIVATFHAGLITMQMANLLLESLTDPNKLTAQVLGLANREGWL